MVIIYNHQNKPFCHWEKLTTSNKITNSSFGRISRNLMIYSPHNLAGFLAHLCILKPVFSVKFAMKYFSPRENGHSVVIACKLAFMTYASRFGLVQKVPRARLIYKISSRALKQNYFQRYLQVTRAIFSCGHWIFVHQFTVHAKQSFIFLSRIFQLFSSVQNTFGQLLEKLCRVLHICVNYTTYYARGQ